MALRSVHIRDGTDVTAGRERSRYYAEMKFVRASDECGGVGAGSGDSDNAGGGNGGGDGGNDDEDDGGGPSRSQSVGEPRQSMADYYAELSRTFPHTQRSPIDAHARVPKPVPPATSTRPGSWFDSKTVLWGPSTSAPTAGSICDKCGVELPSGDPAAVRAHRQTMAHRLGQLGETAPVPKSAASVPTPPPPPKYKLRPTNRGYGILAGMGWHEGMGLGREEWEREPDTPSDALHEPLPIVIKHNRMGVGRRTLVEREPGAVPRPHDAAHARARERADVVHEPSERQTKRQRARREKAARDEWLALRASLK